MTVIRGDAARHLIARHRAAAGHPPPSSPQQTWSATTRAPYGHGAAQSAAEFVALQLTAHGLSDRVADATPVAQELVENARRHGRGAVDTRISLAADGRLLLEVRDEGPTTPELRAATGRGNVQHAASRITDASGRAGTGLKLVAMLSQSWGVRDDDQGKTLWVLLHDHDVTCRGCHPL